MEIERLISLIESLLFVADGPVEIARLQRVIEVEREYIEVALAAMAGDSQRGVRLQRKGEAIQLVAPPEAGPFIEKFLGIERSGKLSAAALETMAIVAYLQPVTRARIEAIRGVNADRALATLMSRSLVEEVGRLETAGRPALFGTTFEFLQHFGLLGLSELPPLDRELPN